MHKHHLGCNRQLRTVQAYQEEHHKSHAAMCDIDMLSRVFQYSLHNHLAHVWQLGEAQGNLLCRSRLLYLRASCPSPRCLLSISIPHCKTQKHASHACAADMSDSEGKRVWESDCVLMAACSVYLVGMMLSTCQCRQDRGSIDPCPFIKIL